MENLQLTIVGKNIAKALGIFHKNVPDIKKDSSNPYFKSKYAGLDSILPNIKGALEKSGLVFTQIPIGENELLTYIIHSESGEYISGTFSMKPVKDDPQGRGSCLTYMRRYSLVSMLGLNTEEDDDGNKSSNQTHREPVENEPEFIDSIATKEGNKCSICAKPILINDKIKYNSKEKTIVHRICFNRNGA